MHTEENNVPNKIKLRMAGLLLSSKFHQYCVLFFIRYFLVPFFITTVYESLEELAKIEGGFLFDLLAILHFKPKLELK